MMMATAHVAHTFWKGRDKAKEEKKLFGIIKLLIMNINMNMNMFVLFINVFHQSSHATITKKNITPNDPKTETKQRRKRRKMEENHIFIGKHGAASAEWTH